ncbi:MAG TPA: transglycosylase domain-containing protein [Phototrophicaceae bacterium]|nr:transglycosylase domain-containing protein [Phototrophicaceae bacterium]
MSDRPNDQHPDEPQNSPGQQRPGGWRTPQQANSPGERHAWRTPEEQQAAAPSVSVPTLPRDLGQQSEQQGGWHLPNPNDTSYSTQDVSLIAPAEPPAAAPPAEASATPAVTENETTSQPVIPFEETTTSSAAAPTPALEPLEEEPDDSFSMSELVALASLVDNVPSVEVQPAPATSSTGQSAPVAASPTQASQPVSQVAGTAEAPVDPAEYARRELARLQALQPVETAAPAAAPAPTPAETPAPAEAPPAIVSPEEYARQQLEKLSAAQQPQPVVPPAASPLTAAQQALAEKFNQADASINALRQQYQQGQITRDQFQADLRNLMVLDDNNVWWMKGVESDRWYRHDNTSGQWIPETPEVLAAQAAVQSASAAIVPASADMGDEGDRTVPTAPIDWIPKQVPVRDPDYTVPGTGAVYLDSTDAGATVPIAARPDLGATVPSVTVPNPAIAPLQYESVAAPIQTDEPPSYDVETASPAYTDAVARQRQSTVRIIAIAAAVIAALLFLVAAIGAIGIVLYYNSLAAPYMDAINNLASYQPQFRTARILAADGSLIAELNSPNGGARTTVALDKISPEMVDAVVANENERYFQDPGWDPIAIVRAFLENLSSGQVVSGASTITQEVARNLVLQDTTVSPQRKLQEIVVAAEIARKYDKNFILQLYLNEVFFGNQSYGVEAASQFYFGHGADSLNLPESALLASLIQAPAANDPVINRQAAFASMDDVLSRMAQVGCLQFTFTPYDKQPFCVTQAQITSPQVVLQKAQVETRNFEPRSYSVKYPHFVNFVQQQIENSFGTAEMFQRGFQIKTTLIPRVQDAAQSALENQVKALATNGVNTGAVMVTTPGNGAIEAMVGSPNFDDTSIDGQVNNAFTWQQPGSSIKIVEYIGALEGSTASGTNQYYTPATILWDVPTTFQNPTYTPVNYDGTFHGPVALRYAFANSYNIPAVKTLNFIGLNKFLDVAQRLGLRFLPDAQFGLPTALGANEVRLYDMMQAYGTIANNGTRVPLFAITGITDADGNALPLPQQAQPAQAIQPQIAFLIQSILSDNSARTPAFGANSPLNVNGYAGLVAAKTGTSNDNRDLWTMGFSSNAVVGVWVGRVDNAPTVNTSGLAAAPIWNAAMTAALQGTNPQPFNPPSGIIQQQICADTGAVYDASVPCSTVRTEYFLQSQPPPASNQGFVVSVPVDTWTGLKANQFCPDSVVTKSFVNIDDPSAIAWLQSAQGQAWATSVGLPNPPQGAPTDECSTSTILPQVKLATPTNGQQLTGAVQFTGIVSGPNFDHYQLELAPASAPTNFQVIAGPFTNQANGALGTWDTTTVPNGAYQLRLSAFSSSGGYRYDTIQIGVNNVIPTVPPPTVAPPVVPTAIGATPIPAQDLNPTPTIFLGG